MKKLRVCSILSASVLVQFTLLDLTNEKHYNASLCWFSDGCYRLCIFMAVFDAQKHGENHDLVLDKREWSCVETKNERYNTTIMAGKVPITQWHNREVCITMKRN